MNNRASGKKKEITKKEITIRWFYFGSIFTGGQNENTFSEPLVCRRRVVLPNVT